MLLKALPRMRPWGHPLVLSRGPWHQWPLRRHKLLVLLPRPLTAVVQPQCRPPWWAVRHRCRHLLLLRRLLLLLLSLPQLLSLLQLVPLVPAVAVLRLLRRLPQVLLPALDGRSACRPSRRASGPATALRGRCWRW